MHHLREFSSVQFDLRVRELLEN
eukprot:SAG11_NODE_10804_length_804_cov_19.255319_1_plen_22_part_10